MNQILEACYMDVNVVTKTQCCVVTFKDGTTETYNTPEDLQAIQEQIKKQLSHDENLQTIHH